MHVLAAGNSAGGVIAVIAVILVIILGFIAYIVPTIVALRRHVPNAGSVIVINMLLGWSIIGWAVALAMACRDNAPRYPYPAAPTYYPPQQQPPYPAPENGR